MAVSVRKTLYFLVLLCLLHNSFQRSTPQDDHYVAAVVEYAVSRNVDHNQQEYTRLIKEAADQQADIVVFPELTLTNATTSFEVPINGLLREFPVPAEHPELYNALLVSMSEAARSNQIYVVLNTRELVNCVTNDSNEVCPEARQYIFNTNIVLDRSGAVIDRYRKINLFGEPGHTTAITPDLGIFQTDFGVTFGHFICFDLMFQVPAIQVVQKNQITDVIFTTMWFSELPYLTAVEIQEAYAYAMNVNFLGAGANNPGVGSAGSGIFSGKAGALVSIMPGVLTTRLLVSKVPKVPGQVTEPVQGPIYDLPSTQDGLVLITDPSLVAHRSRLLVDGLQEFTLQDKDVSCSFRVNLNMRDGDNVYKYRAAAFSGVRSFSGVATGGTRICSVIACTGDTMETCGRRFPVYTANTTANFQELSITANVPTPIVTSLDATDSNFFPTSLKTSIMPLNSDDYTYTSAVQGSITTFRMNLVNFDEDLYSFAVWGRVFETDGQEADPAVVDDVEVDDDGGNGAAGRTVFSWLSVVPLLVLIGRY